MPSNTVAWVEGSANADKIVFELSNQIVNAKLPDDEENGWTESYRSVQDKWVTYTPVSTPSTAGMYTHMDGKKYPVYKLSDLTGAKNPATEASLVDSDGYVKEVNTFNFSNTPTGRKLLVTKVAYTDPDTNLPVVRPVADLLVVNVDDATRASKKACYIVKQGYSKGSNFTDHARWQDFKIVAPMPSDYDSFLANGQLNIYLYINKDYGAVAPNLALPYNFNQLTYKADLTHYSDTTVVLKSVKKPPEGQSAKDFYVMLKMPAQQFNYFDVYYGGNFKVVEAAGSSLSTYNMACDIATVKINQVPTVKSQVEAHLAYLKWNDPDTSEGKYTPAYIEWLYDYDGTTQVTSPPAHFFFGANSTVSWLANKKRRPDYGVNYWLSVNNNRVALVLEGDPAPDIEGYYRSFGYIGRIIPFNDTDYAGNFGVTVGMGDMTVEKSGFTIADIRVDQNPAYAGFGRNTSNGMYSFSMFRTASNVMYQSYYPAFITQLPSYSGVGSIPSDLSKLILDKTKNFFQASVWTKRYHASPVYLVHQYEGYRGYMDGVVAINDFNLINKDELIVDTEEWKDPADHSKGTWTEVYKFFSVNSPVNFLKFSANPDECSIAILKEVK
ncbi:hypothetical protein [Paenibacillus sp. P32E]|uniref:hypothetical protein n=1 Tax=Paenibacillus sp. P32E TaxID=1349434 RepID=UPI000939774B|nr:hypothetical protein [Paenibacillus sp. P32E]OKP93673.1 hypothetical protein A3848_03970 [Paenibacillus sp. P32E]